MKLTATVNTSNTNMNMGETAGFGGSQYSLIPADFYTVVVRSMSMGTFQGRSGSHINPNSGDGKWTYVKLLPDVVFLNENATHINRQDFVAGVFENGEFIRPDGDESKLPIWGQALFMLKSLGLFKDLGDGKFQMEFDPDHINNRVIRVRTGYAGYIKGVDNFDEDSINGILSELYGGDTYPFADVAPLVLLYNVRNGYSTITDDGVPVPAEDVTLEVCQQVFDADSSLNAEQDDVRLKLKNSIIGWYSLNERDIEEGGFFKEPETPEGMTPQVFEDEASYETYQRLLELDESPASTDGW